MTTPEPTGTRKQLSYMALRRQAWANGAFIPFPSAAQLHCAQGEEHFNFACAPMLSPLRLKPAELLVSRRGTPDAGDVACVARQDFGGAGRVAVASPVAAPGRDSGDDSPRLPR